MEKMRAHAQSDIHVQSCEAEMVAATQGTIIQQLQHVGEEEKTKNRVAIKALIRCTHFLTRHHIPHTTNFDQLIDLVVSCGGEHLKHFMERAGKNATYTSKVAVTEFVEAIGQWVEESLLSRLHQASVFSWPMNVQIFQQLKSCPSTVAGVPTEHFLEILPLKRANAEAIYSAIVSCLKEKSIQVSKLVGMGFDGAATFSGKKSGVQSRLKTNSPHALFVHCHCHLLQLACVQAANNTNGIKHVYTTLTTLWKFYHYSPKRAETLKDVQTVLDLPELKVIKPSDTRWLARERCVKSVKRNYSAIVISLNNMYIYEVSHEPEALGLS